MDRSFYLLNLPISFALKSKKYIFYNISEILLPLFIDGFKVRYPQLNTPNPADQQPSIPTKTMILN